MSIVFDESMQNLQNNKNDLEENLQDSFGQALLQDVFEPLENSVRQLQFTDESSTCEATAIKGLLAELRMII